MISNHFNHKSLRFELLAIATLVLVSAFYGIATMPGQAGSVNIDSQVYNLGGKVLADGGTLYKDFFDHKGPAIYLLNKLGYCFAGIEYGIWLIDLALLLTAMLTLYRGIKARINSGCAMLLSIVSVSIYDFELANKPEFYCAVAIWISLGLILRTSDRWAAVIAGALGAAVFFMKQTLIGYFIALFVYYLLTVKHNRCNLFWYCGSGVVTSMLFVLYLLSNGVFGDYYDCCFRFNMLYSNQNALFGRGFDPSRLQSALFSFCWTIGSANILSVVLAALILIGRRNFRLLIASTVFLCWEFFFLCRTGHFYPYHFTGMIVGINLSFIVLFALVRDCPTRYRSWLWMLACLILSCSLFNSSTYATNLKKAVSCLTKTKDEDSLNDELLLKHLDSLPDGAIFCWGNKCSLYYLTGRRSPSRYYYHTPLALLDGIPDDEATTLIEHLAGLDDLIIIDCAFKFGQFGTPIGYACQFAPDSRFKELLTELVKKDFVPVDTKFTNATIYVRHK